MSENYCICCGEIIPEGYLVCAKCYAKATQPERFNLTEQDKIEVQRLSIIQKMLNVFAEYKNAVDPQAKFFEFCYDNGHILAKTDSFSIERDVQTC